MLHTHSAAHSLPSLPPSLRPSLPQAAQHPKVVRCKELLIDHFKRRADDHQKVPLPPSLPPSLPPLPPSISYTDPPSLPPSLPSLPPPSSVLRAPSSLQARVRQWTPCVRISLQEKLLVRSFMTLLVFVLLPSWVRYVLALPSSLPPSLPLSSNYPPSLPPSLSPSLLPFFLSSLRPFLSARPNLPLPSLPPSLPPALPPSRPQARAGARV